MPKLSSRDLIKLILVASTLMVAPRVGALADTGIPTSPKNNVRDCNPTVQRELKDVAANDWGAFKLDCRDGYVGTLYVPQASRIDKRLREFVRAHWRLFDSMPVLVIDDGAPLGSRTIVLRRRGLPYHAGRVKFGLLEDNSHVEHFYFHPQSIPDEFSASPRISKETAIETSLTLAAGRGHLPNKVKKSELIIRHCSRRSSHPHLVWWIQISAGTKNTVTCFIDAESGQTCYGSERCHSTDDVINL